MMGSRITYSADLPVSLKKLEKITMLVGAICSYIFNAEIVRAEWWKEVDESASNSDDLRPLRHGRSPTRLLPAPTAFHQPRRFSDLAENPQGHIVR